MPAGPFPLVTPAVAGITAMRGEPAGVLAHTHTLGAQQGWVSPPGVGVGLVTLASPLPHACGSHLLLDPPGPALGLQFCAALCLSQQQT